MSFSLNSLPMSQTVESSRVRHRQFARHLSHVDTSEIELVSSTIQELLKIKVVQKGIWLYAFKAPIIRVTL